ncbi:flagellar FLiS export co-chaperone [uncultured Helicobacter sp.]|uniref:flagellar FLiS export co-chaperone n=1 Tax=uncultured Helicobacter sp. TaxID=175537 RepID=UPI002613654F|nr:flagellar FLiS export co-chaperone [uncultured Helicobacter sp.]
MLSSVNPYGIGNIYPNPQVEALKPTIAQEAQIQGVEFNNTQEAQELPELSQIALEIRKFSDGIKGANEMIGAMQIADMTLNGLGNQIKSSGENVAQLDNTAKAAQFKGESLFGRELTLSLAGENVSLSLPFPSQMEGSISKGLANKHNEIMQKMGQISGLIEKASLPISASSTQEFDFENFDANSLKGLFG